jgi:Fic family protein
LFGPEATPARAKIAEKLLAELNGRQLQLIDTPEHKKRITAPEWGQIVDINRYTAKLDLERLFKLNIADRKGLRRGTFYTLK